MYYKDLKRIYCGIQVIAIIWDNMRNKWFSCVPVFRINTLQRIICQLLVFDLIEIAVSVFFNKRN